jgi:hypothetical protein
VLVDLEPVGAKFGVACKASARRFAEEWTYRFLTTALADASDPSASA